MKMILAYKNKTMADYDIADNVELMENSPVKKTMTLDEDSYDAVKLIVVRETETGYVPVTSKLLTCNDTNDFKAEIESDDFAVRCDMDYHNAEVGVNISAKKAIGEVLVIAKNPNGKYEYIDVVDANDVTGLEFALTEPYAENQPYTVTVSSVTYGKYLFETKTFAYIGETTINGILEDIKLAADEEEYFKRHPGNAELSVG